MENIQNGRSHRTRTNEFSGLGDYYFGGGFLMNSTPFAMLPFRPATAASRSFFSWSVTPSRMLMAFSAPLG